MTINYSDIQKAQARIAPIIHTTPIVSSSLLNQYLGHEVLFKAECLQKTGSFKIRGAANFVTHYLEHKPKPDLLVANSSGNHAQAVAFTGRQTGIPVRIFASANISPVKAAATKSYGAELSLFEHRKLADEAVQQCAAEHTQSVWIPPYNHPDIIAGQGTACVEALEQCGDVDAVFMPCGGGGLASGSLIATRHLIPKAKVIAAEPLAANDAAQSRRAGKIITLKDAPQTIADGVATPSVGEHTFKYIQQLDELIEVEEEAIIYWTQWLQHLLKMHLEPTCAMPMQAVIDWLRRQHRPQKVLMIISGGNISAETMRKVWQNDYLNAIPKL